MLPVFLIRTLLLVVPLNSSSTRVVTLAGVKVLVTGSVLVTR